MSSFIETSGSGGVDLNELTTGERWLIGMLDLMVQERSSASYCYTDYTLNFSKVKSIGMKGCGVTSNASLQVDIWFYPSATSSSYTTYKRVTFGYSSSAEMSTQTLYLGTSNTEYSRVSMSVSGSDSTARYCITSFTTIDNKVHTKTNLNY